MRGILILVFLLSSCTVLKDLPPISQPTDIEIIGWRFDKEHFTNNMECHQKFMSTDEKIESYFQLSDVVSKQDWDENTHQFACLIKGTFTTNAGQCTFLIWEGGKGILSCPERSDAYFSTPQQYN